MKTLDQVDPNLRKLDSLTSTTPTQLDVPFGLFDNPLRHTQPPWNVDLTNNHVLLTGGSQVGKSTAIKTLVSSLALNNHPRRVQMYVIDYAGGGLAPLLDLPHVGGVATRADPDAINRMLVQTKDLIASRERLFREHRIPTMKEYRELVTRADSSSSSDAFGDVFVIIDGWDAAVAPGQILNGRGGEIESLIAGALNYGVHFVFTTSRVVEMRGIGPHINLFIELHSGEISRIKSSLAKERPQAAGRAITSGSELQGLIALPRIDGVADTANMGAGLDHLIKAISTHEFTQQVEKLRTLPISLLRSEIAELVPPVGADERRRLRLPLGVRESTLRPAYAEMYREPHLVIYGEPKSGKSELIGTVIDSIARMFPTEDDAEIVLLDPRNRPSGADSREEPVRHCSPRQRTGVGYQ
ncbi:FtsK/SpoIIIE domain-containing protein [Mycobacterium montefiorense]|uniref:FtsK/SpoIIIE domain-containing protein n=1 Tax=Mycobacterium montefiorense TaxID=154654 RepID=UPI0014034D1B|nr:FtsK/SpoIIIE domain-containing protein [Mycobacterium montefiorense]